MVQSMIKIFLIITASLFFTACGDGGTSPDTKNVSAALTVQEKAIRHIAEYAQSGGPAPTVQDYIEAGVIGVTEENLDRINAAVKKLSYEEVDTRAEIQALFDSLGLECAQVITHAYNPVTGEEKDFPTPCDIPDGWIVGTPPEADTGDTNKTNPADTIKPVIRLLGENPVILTVGDSYADAGATATDNKDGDITNKIIVTSDVNSSKEGTYYVRYNVSDQAGNAANTVTRTVNVETAPKDFGAFGSFEVLRYPDAGLSDDHYVVYYPKDAITPDMPVVVFLEGGGEDPKIDDYRGIMEFMASQGYFVIGTEQGGSYDSSYGASIAQSAIDTAIEHHQLTLKKIAVMGHSQGGGQAFYMMKYLQDKGYGAEGSLTLSLDGWFAFGMDQADLHALKGEVGFIQMNGREGTGTDPRIKLTIWNLAKQTQRRFFTLPENEHGYVAGDRENIDTKDDIRLLIGALTHDVFEESQEGNSAIPSENKTTYDAIKNALKKKDQYHGGDCQGAQYNARRGMLHLNDIGYCNFEAVYPDTAVIASRAVDDAVVRPAKGESVEDPVFHTMITRINKSDSALANYPKVQSWNSDMTLLKIGNRLYDALTLQESNLTKNKTNAEAYQVLCSRSSDYFRWSTTEPDTFYVLNSSKKFIKGKINENSISCTDELESFSDYEVVHMGPYEGNIDLQDRYVLFAVKKPNDTAIYLVLYDIQNRSRVWNTPKVLPENTWVERDDGYWVPSQMDWISVSPSGNHIVINEVDKDNYQKGLRVYDMNFSNEHILKYDYNGQTYSEGGHGDMGYDAQGNEVMVEFLTGLPVHMFYLDQPDVLGKAMLPGALGGGHVSCRNYQRPGWCYITTHQEDYRRVFALKLDADPQYKVQNFSQSHIHDNYPETYGAASPDGSKVIFNSNWDNNDGTVDTYMAEAKQ